MQRTRRGDRTFGLRCNGVRFAALLDYRGSWNVFEGGTSCTEKRRKDKHPVLPGDDWDESPLTWKLRTLEGGVLIGVAHDVDEMHVLVRELAPPRPPAE